MPPPGSGPIALPGPRLLEAAQGALEYARELDWAQRGEQPRKRSENSADPAATLPQSLLEVAQGAKVFFGRVTDSLPAAHWYKVQPELGLPVIPCCLLSGGPLGVMGTRGLGQLPPDTPVVFVWREGQPHGRIIGVEPEQRLLEVDNYSDQVSLSSRCGVRVDALHQAMLGLPLQGTVTDWSANRPLDALACGEGGLQAETGVGFFADAELAYLRANEDTGVWAFRGDDLLRVAGRNLQRRSAAAESEELDDQNELTTRRGESPYAWERLGLFEYGQPPLRVQPQPPPGETYVEPLYHDQQPFDRVARYGGYLGQGGRRQACLPPEDRSGVNRYSVDRTLAGACTEQVQLTGAYRLASAHSLTLTKRLLQPAPRQRKRPEDPAGDNPDNYRFAGLWGGGADHRVLGGPVADDGGPDATAVEGGLLSDRLSYGFAWESLVPFRKHAQDWHTPEESELVQFEGTNQAPLDLTPLQTQQRLTAPPPYLVWVDHRYGEVRYYPNSSTVELSPQGNLNLVDGFASSIRTQGGNLELACPGDIVLRPGRNVVVMAGKDVVVRARDAVDVSTTVNDVRVRAGRDLKLRSIRHAELYSGGDVTARALDGNTRFWVGNFYVQSTGNGADTEGSIHLDAGTTGMVTVHARSMRRFLDVGAFDLINNRTAHVFSADGAELDGNVFVTGCLAASGSIYTGGWFSAEGHISTGLSLDYDSTVAVLATTGLAALQNIINTGVLAQKQAILDCKSAFAAVYTDCLYAAATETAQAGDGNSTLIATTVFHYRSVDDYATKTYTLFEAPWQQQLRLQGSDAGTTAWVEQDEDKTYPYPGDVNFVGSVYMQQDLLLYDAVNGRSEDTGGPDGGPYANPTEDPPAPAGLNTDYLVIDFGQEPPA